MKEYKMKDKTINIIGVETGDGVYISEFNKGSWNKYLELKSYIVNGESVKGSHLEGWSLIKNVPSKVQKTVSQPDINKRWELKDVTLESDKFPLVLEDDKIKYDYDLEQWGGEKAEYISLYSKKSDKQEDKLENVEFTYEKVCSIDKINTTENKYSEYGKVQHQLVDRMIHPEIVLSEKPSSYTSQQTYNIIRAYVKDNIDPKVSVITSDYDFCFTVEKRIKLSKEVSYTVDTNNSIFDKRKRKPKIVTRFRTERKIKLFEMTHSPECYQGYTPIKPFIGKDHEDLQNKIDEYLNNLMEMINEPLIDCPNCKGSGVLLGEWKEL